MSSLVVSSGLTVSTIKFRLQIAPKIANPVTILIGIGYGVSAIIGATIANIVDTKQQIPNAVPLNRVGKDLIVVRKLRKKLVLTLKFATSIK